MLGMRGLTTELIGCSRKTGMVGVELVDRISGELRRKGTSKLTLLPAPPDALLRQVGILVEAHLLDLLSVAGMAPVVGSFSDSGGSLRMRSRDRGRLRKNGEASRF
jgi:hypothetical protein